MTEPDKPLEQMTVQERFSLGMSHYREGRFDEAIEALSSIRQEEADPKTYAQAQLGLGTAYAESGELDEAIKTWSNISHDDGPKTYAQAQLNLGNAYHAHGEPEQAIKTWSKIRRNDDPEIYAQAQFNLGVVYDKSGKLVQAIKTWSKIRRSDDPEAYARAQLNLGAAYYAQEDWKQAIKTWSKIRRKKIAPETYARAQFNLGAAYYAQEDWKQAIKTWSKIRREKIAPETYARAQFNLGNTYKDQGNPEQAIKTWSNIRHEEAAPETYARAQLGLGEVYSLDKETEEQSHEAYDNVRDFSYYKSERGFKILKCPGGVRKDLHSLAENTDKVLKSLQMIPEFESKVAHYSRPSTAFNLFGDEKNNKKPSNFRLNTIRGVNDPTEGLVLRDYWKQQGIPETIHTNDNATFISCFTFNHDSLNQFRLYGKENGQEATGVSLVFNKEFFSDQSDVLKFIAAPSTDLSSKPEQIKPNDTGKTESDNKKPSIDKSTLYRCIYLDPETGYWTLGQRDKSTFYRDGKRKAKEEWEKYQKSVQEKGGNVERYLFITFYRKYKEKIEKEWERYQKLMQEKEENFKKYLFNDDISILHLFEKIFPKCSSCTEKENQQVLETIRFILLPLQYLVKHIAFQEEQECRIMYVTQSRGEKIHGNHEEQQMYVEYDEPVLPHIDRIWLSPGAAKHQDSFRILLDQGSGKSKVCISQNPFRNKE